MRLAAQVKGGFYAAAPEAVALVGKLIQYQGGAILDPCAGEGEAIDTLATALGVPREKVYAVELERDRAAVCRTRLEGANVMDPCSFFDAKINSESLTLAWVNPPFDTNVHGGRAEVDFLRQATRLLTSGGILCYVVPEHVVERDYPQYSVSIKWLLERFEQLAVLKFPEEHRPYEEVVVIGVKRKGGYAACEPEFWRENVPEHDLADCPLRWQAPAKDVAPRTFEKGGYTEEELTEALAASPLWKLTDVAPVAKVARPPLPLSKGHIALLLASGQLDGVVSPAGEEPHVVRGVATKVQCPPESTEEVLSSGAVKTTTVIRERIQLVVRAIGSDGVIRTFE